MGKQKGTTKAQGQKHALDQFFTKKEIVEQCISILPKEDYDLIIEPSAGSGNFSNAFENVLSYDIDPQGDNIIKADWFEVDKKQFNDSKSLVIGNPPFGQQNKLAISFFNESAKFAKTIAFVLPLSFKKNSIQNKLDLNFSLVEELILPRKAFTLNGKDYAVPCVFQVWSRTEKPRKKIILKTTTSLFDFTTPDMADIRMPRVGGNASKATLALSGATSSNYFIKNNTDHSNEELVKLLNSASYPSIEYTVGPKSLGKGELIYEFEKYYNNL